MVFIILPSFTESPRGKNFCDMIAIQKGIYMSKVIFYILDFVAGTKTWDSGSDRCSQQ